MVAGVGLEVAAVAKWAELGEEVTEVEVEAVVVEEATEVGEEAQEEEETTGGGGLEAAVRPRYRCGTRQSGRRSGSAQRRC